MNSENTRLSKEELQSLIAKDDRSIQAYFSQIPHAGDIIEIFRQVAVDDWPRFLRLIQDEDKRAEVVSGLDRDEWKNLLNYLSAEEIAGFIKELETDDAADLLGDVPLPERFDALRMLTSKERLQVQQLLRYPEDSAGGIMQLELAQVSESATVKDAIKIVRGLVEEDVEVLSVLVVDQDKQLIGTLALVDLLLNKETTQVREIMEREFVFVKPLVDQEEVAAIFKKYDLIMLPVLDDQMRVLGRIVIDDVIDVLSEEAEEDALHMAGTSAEELLHTSNVLATARVRLPWLGVALCCSLVSGWMLHIFEPTVEKAVIILAFIPVITAMGGNVGTQSATLLIRGFATGKLDLNNIPQVIFKEARVGLLMGLVYGLFAGGVATFILSNFNFYFGLLVFCSMITAMMTAAILGILAPSILKRLNADPAIAAGPFVTTLNDISGILIYMIIATLLLSQIQTG